MEIEIRPTLESYTNNECSDDDQDLNDSLIQQGIDIDMMTVYEGETFTIKEGMEGFGPNGEYLEAGTYRVEGEKVRRISSKY